MAKKREYRCNVATNEYGIRTITGESVTQLMEAVESWAMIYCKISGLIAKRVPYPYRYSFEAQEVRYSHAIFYARTHNVGGKLFVNGDPAFACFWADYETKDQTLLISSGKYTRSIILPELEKYSIAGGQDVNKFITETLNSMKKLKREAQ